MEAVTARKRHIESRLEQDDAKINQLCGSLARSQKLTTDMVGILESFQGRLNKLDKTIMPVYQKTKQLTQLQENVDHTLSALERVIGYHHIADEVEPKLREGPKGNIEGYLKLLDKLRSAVDFFKHNNPASMELSHVNTCFDRGIELLEKEFRELLRQHSLPVQFSVLQKLVDEDTEEGAVTIKHLPEDTVKDLNTIAKYVVNSGENRTDLLSGYAQIRSNTLGRTLNSYMETSVSRKQAFAPFAAKPSPVKKQSTKRKEGAGEARSKIVQGKISTTSLLAGEVAGSPDEYLEGCSILVKSSIILLKLLQTEWALMEHVVPPRHHGYVFGLLITSPIDYFARKGEAVLQHAQRQLSRHEYLTIIPLLKIIKQIHRILPEHNTLLFNATSTGDDTFRKIPHLLEVFEKIAQKGLQDYIVYIKGDSEKHSNLPKDGTVHELTSTTMWFLEQMLEYSDTVGQLNPIELKDISEDEAVGHYIVRVLDALTLNLEQKSRTYESPVLASVFLLNNYFFIQATFTRKESMLHLMSLAHGDVENNYITLIESQRRTYQRGFSKLLGYLGQTSVNNPPTKNQRQRLKDNFKAFNTELEELFRTQQQYSIPDGNLRRRVRDENVTLIVLPYTTFYKEYSGVSFTKNPEKYLKYRPEDVEVKLNSFFDQGAQ